MFVHVVALAAVQLSGGEAVAEDEVVAEGEGGGGAGGDGGLGEGWEGGFVVVVVAPFFSPVLLAEIAEAMGVVDGVPMHAGRFFPRGGRELVR